MIAPTIDEHRDDAARLCEETARQERGERPPLRIDPTDGASTEFSDSAAWIAAEVATVVSHAVKSARRRAAPDQVWDIAAKLLRSGWQRGHKLVGMSVGGGTPS